jgi:hypothetical protein
MPETPKDAREKRNYKYGKCVPILSWQKPHKHAYLASLFIKSFGFLPYILLSFALCGFSFASPTIKGLQGRQTANFVAVRGGPDTSGCEDDNFLVPLELNSEFPCTFILFIDQAIIREEIGMKYEKLTTYTG